MSRPTDEETEPQGDERVQSESPGLLVEGAQTRTCFNLVPFLCSLHLPISRITEVPRKKNICTFNILRILKLLIVLKITYYVITS